MQPRKNPDRSHGEKLIALFAKLLFTGERHSLSDLASSLDCSKQTVLRLLDDITLAYEIPLHEEIQGNRKYVWIERTDEIEHAALISQSEFRSLQMCQAFTQHLLGDKTYRDAIRAVEKSCHHLPPPAEPGDSMFGVVYAGTIDYSKHEKILRTLLAGMEKRRVCKIRYQKLAGAKIKSFHIKPLKIFSHQESVYVHARLARTPGKPYKTPKFDPLLAVHRFRGAELTDTPFRRPSNYNFEKVMNQGFGIFAQKRYRVVIDLTGWAAAYARERRWSPDQSVEEIGDVTRLSFWATSEPEVLSLVLSFGPAAKLVEPEGLVEELRGKLGEMSNSYL